MTQPVENLVAQFIANRVGRDYEFIDVQMALSLLDFLKAEGWQVIEVPRANWGIEDEEVPEVEVTHSSSSQSVEAQESPVAARRSAARNVSAPRLQMAFMDEARASMGQPSERDVTVLLGQRVTIVFNVDRPPVTGELTRVIHHPANSPTYVILDHEENVLYPLASIQSIEAVG